jgi:L-iduronidase
MKLTVRADRDLGPFDAFWQSTGFTPSRLLFDPVMKQTLIHTASIPHDGITHLRIHFLLDLIWAKNLGTDRPVYNWSQLDQGLDELHGLGFKPFFELMGNVSGCFNDYKNPEQAHSWRRLIRDLALHLIERYGRDEVRSWHFETWNEPDVGWWKQDIDAFLIYYDACSEGLKEADPQLKFGGPGTCRHMSPTVLALLEHCDRGRNYFTGETGVRIDFISVHEKGRWDSREDIPPQTQGMVDRLVTLAQHVRQHHPGLANVPMMNNESDPIVGWGDIHGWHGRPYYAAWIARAVDLHLHHVRDKHAIPFTLLGNDHGFTGTWGQRTLLAQLGDPEDIAAGRFELIKKPVFNAMVLLSLLGTRRCEMTGDRTDALGGFTTLRDGQVAILVWHSVDRTHLSGQAHVEVDITGLPKGEYAAAQYLIAEGAGDPFITWDREGARKRPSAECLSRMRLDQELSWLNTPYSLLVSDGKAHFGFDLPLPGVSLLLLTPKREKTPARVTDLRAWAYPGLTINENILLKWLSPADHTIRTYEVLYADKRDGTFKRVNDRDLVCTAYMHVRKANPDKGFYKVRAVDFWGRSGPESDILTF